MPSCIEFRGVNWKINQRQRKKEREKVRETRTHTFLPEFEIVEGNRYESSEKTPAGFKMSAKAG